MKIYKINVKSLVIQVEKFRNVTKCTVKIKSENVRFKKIISKENLRCSNRAMKLIIVIYKMSRVLLINRENRGVRARRANAYWLCVY